MANGSIKDEIDQFLKKLGEAPMLTISTVILTRKYSKVLWHH